MIFSLLLCLLGLCVSACTTPYFIQFSRKGFGLESDTERKGAHGLTPRLGGLPIMVALTSCLALIFWISRGQAREWTAILAGGTLMFGLGTWDDLRRIPARWKIGGQVLIAALVYLLGLGIAHISYANAHWNVRLGPTASFLTTIFWLITIPNVIDLIDGFEGLASGLAMFMSVTLGIVATLSNQMAEAWFAFSLAGGLMGFLFFNLPPSRMLLGDGGAYLVGFCIAGLSLKTSNKGAVASVLLVTVVVLGIPILDATFTILRRIARGFPMFQSDEDHIHHRLRDLGFSTGRILIAMYGICVLLSLVGLSIFWSQGRTIPIAVGMLFLLAVFAARYLHYVRSWTDLRSQLGRVLSRRQTVRYALLQAQLLEMEIQRCDDADEFWLLFQNALRRVGLVARGPGEKTREAAIIIPFGGSGSLTMVAPVNARTWVRIVECFQPAYEKALAKWDEPLEES